MTAPSRGQTSRLQFYDFLMLLRTNAMCQICHSVFCNLLKTISSEEVERFPPIDTTGSLA